MIDPKILKEGQSIVLRQNKNNGKWQEFIINKEGRILAVEDVKLFEKSKLENQKPNNYEELKKNYQYLSKKEELSPPISISEDLPDLDNKELEPSEVEPAEHECDRECPDAPCSICSSDAPPVVNLKLMKNPRKWKEKNTTPRPTETSTKKLKNERKKNRKSEIANLKRAITRNNFIAGPNKSE
jgi:uncharacterized protein YfkK (UPF0435 family)